MNRLIVFVSRQVFADEDPVTGIARISEIAKCRNAKAGIGGTLVCTRDHFASLLVGPDQAVTKLMARIEQDPRHSHLRVIQDQRGGGSAQFKEWSVGYSGASTFVARQIAPFFSDEPPSGAEAVARLVSLLTGLA